MKGFVGRRQELHILHKRIDRVAASAEGVAVAIRGRRQVGKSRLVQEFCNQAAVPYMFFSATKGASTVESVRSFRAELQASSLPDDPSLIPSLDTGSWSDAFRILATAIPRTPSIVVLDEVPWLGEQDRSFDGALQTAWDRLLKSRPVLLLLLGSDIGMMERLTAYDQPFFGRADNLLLAPLNLAEVADVLELAGSDAIDAHLVSGGLPGILRSWPPGLPALPFIERECDDPAAPLFSVPESALMAEFPLPDQARRVLEAIGTGDRTQANIAASASGGPTSLPSGSLSPLLSTLVEEKRVVAADAPLSTTPGKPTLYRIADSNLRLYLAALRSAQDHARRGQARAAFQLLERRWKAWRGRAVEPLVRLSLLQAALSDDPPWPDVEVVGGWWNRRFDPELDLVGGDAGPIARHIHFVGSIKWLGTPFDTHDLTKLRAGAVQVPGFVAGATGMAVVSLSGVTPDVDDRIDLLWGPEEILDAWRA